MTYPSGAQVGELAQPLKLSARSLYAFRIKLRTAAPTQISSPRIIFSSFISGLPFPIP